MLAGRKQFLALVASFCAIAVVAQDEFDFLEDEASSEEVASGDEEAADGEELASEDEASGEESGEAAASGDETGKVPPARKDDKVFYSLMRCTRAQGDVQIMRPGTSGWQKVVEGHYYPMGAVIRANRTAAVLPDMPACEFEFGRDAKIQVKESAEFATRHAQIGEQVRTVVLRSGVVNVVMPRNMAKGKMFVASPHYLASDLAGESVFAFRPTADGDESVVRIVTGTLALSGAHYNIPEMSAADRLRIRTTGDDLETFLRGETGTFKVVLDQGIEKRLNIEKGTEEERPANLEYLVTPRCAVKIFRQKSSVADRMIVSTLTFDAKGKIQNRRVFVEGLYNINSGELVLKPMNASLEGDGVKAAEETTAVEATDEDFAEEENSGDSSTEDASGESEAEAEEDIF